MLKYSKRINNEFKNGFKKIFLLKTKIELEIIFYNNKNNIYYRSNKNDWQKVI